MKRIERQPPRRFFTRAERTRLISLIFFLIVLVMLIQSSGNPDLWSHWVGKGGQQRVGDKGTEPEVADKAKSAVHGKALDAGQGSPRPAAPATIANARSAPRPESGGDSRLAQATPTPSSPNPAAPAQPAPSASSGPNGATQDTTAISNGHGPNAAGNLPKPAMPGSEAGQSNGAPDNSTLPADQDATAKAPPPIPKATGPTDEDPDEQGEAAEDFDMIEDADAVGVQVQESQAYERMVRWVTNQPYAYLVSRAQKKSPTFGEFIESPAEHRQLGKLYQFDLQLRKLAAFPEPFTFDHSDNDPHDPIALYEAWGTMDEAKGRLFSLVVVDPPKGLPLGNSLREDVHFVGYFFKLLAYEPARTLPGGKMLKAPILIGRIQWIRPGPAVLIGSNDLIWAIVLGGGVALALVIWVGSVLWSRKARNLVPLATERSLPPGVTIDDWLEHAESGELKADDDLNPAPLVIDDQESPHSSNGHAKEGGKMRAEE